MPLAPSSRVRQWSVPGTNWFAKERLRPGTEMFRAAIRWKDSTPSQVANDQRVARGENRHPCRATQSEPLFGAGWNWLTFEAARILFGCQPPGTRQLEVLKTHGAIRAVRKGI